MTAHRAVAVIESSQASAARLDARELALRAGLDETDAHRVGLVATELATNLVKHARNGGELLMHVSDRSPVEIELIALDRGPGIRDVALALSDGHSTAGSSGTGLGAIRRMSEDFDICSIRDGGTAVLARLRAKRAPRRPAGVFQIAAVAIARQGEPVSGDAWEVRHYSGGAMVLMADGLGHGLMAKEAAEAAVSAFAREPMGAPARALESIHAAIRHTRGAAAAIADVSRDLRAIRFSGVGNIVAVVCDNGTIRHAVSNNGTLGHHAQYFREYSYPWSPDSMLVMHSDGLSARWTLDRYPGLASRHPALIAAVLYRDFRRSRDDATVLVAKGAA
jgi:anti-sigma regulatory factor (Ser/Thr protein kinase)